MCEDEERKRDPLPLVYNKMKQKETQILYDDKNNFRWSSVRHSGMLLQLMRS